ncbi:hypothetical protein IQ268_05180 [Oculatella sp. LEGE 06141]|uniref:hypothetical protein n=1 Tax=Oculatella sp. LEGE 06141 TaxID=1828648 RepID=UPI00187ED31D|nr:hypothetical protein [Oculatella sp. LEGE 06141]MBE9177976.1 hypothetical protein [Oculatella sp. LEGE 06141]
MMSRYHHVCFCTLALGKKYRSLALLLAGDLETYSPGKALVVLTDDPSHFQPCSNVLAFKHSQQGVTCYHDKRFVIQTALSHFEACIFIDADMRVVGEVPHDLTWLPGITARSGCSTLKHNQNRKARSIVEKVAHKWNLNLETVLYVNEFLFVVSKDAGKEADFLQAWDWLAPYFELNGIYSGEGSAIGLAAAKAGLDIRLDTVDRFPFFKDRIEKIRISKGDADPHTNQRYFDEQRRYEFPQLSLSEKLVAKVSKPVKRFCRLIQLRIDTLKHFSFYYK